MLAAPVDFGDPFGPQLLESMRFWRARLVVYPTSGNDSVDVAAKRFGIFVDDLNRIVRLYKVRNRYLVRRSGRCWRGMLHAFCAITTWLANAHFRLLPFRDFLGFRGW